MKSAAIVSLHMFTVLSLVFLSAPMVMPVGAQSFSCSNVTEIPQIECEALLALYNSTGGDYWKYNNNWLVTNTPSNWYGVTVASGHVTRISFSFNQLSGTIPPELGNLVALQHLSLYAGYLTGSIPTELGNLAALQHLDLSGNDLNGGIPSELGSLAALQNLDLCCNDLTESIPPELGTLTALRYLDLDSNELTGSIPPELGNLTALQELILSENQLTGSIPPELGNLAALKVLDLSGGYYEMLTGSIPAELGNLAALEELSLRDNSLTGSIPPELGNLTSLRWLILERNDLTGTIPPELANLSLLEWLDLGLNHLGGGIPPELGSMPALISLDLWYNELTGSIPPELGNLSTLWTLDLSYNQLTEGIPPELGNLTALRALYLHNNQLAGSIPPELGNLPALENLELDSNQLTGSIPPELGNLALLDSLDLSTNELTGSIPLSFINLSRLDTFRFSETYLCEPTTPEYLAWKAAVDARFSYEGTGISCRDLVCTSVTEIPQAECEALYWLYKNTLGDFWTDNTNWLLTDTPSDWYGVTVSNGHVTQLDLSSNALKLTLPPNLGDLSALQVLALQANPLQGHVPLSLVNLSQLDTFYFFETDLCELPRPEYLAWKETVGDYQGTGVCQTWTLMYYQAGDSKDENGGDMGEHMLWQTERLKAESNNPYVNIAVFRDTLSQPAVYEAYIDGQMVASIPKGELNTGLPETLSDFVQWGKTSFPADHYALVIFGHGHGQRGTAQDLTTNDPQPEDFIDPKEFRTAVVNSGPLDVIFMESCLMANLEHAYQARDQALYYIASEALTMGPLDHGYLSRISPTTSPADLAYAMAFDYRDYTSGSKNSRTISVGDLSGIELVAQRTNAFAAAIRAHRVDLGFQIWQIIYGNDVQRFEENGNGVIDENDILADLYHFAELVGELGDPELTVASQVLRTAIDDYVVLNLRHAGSVWDHSHAHGLSILLTKKLACYYTSDWFDFSGDVSWFCNPGAQATDQQPGEWGQMLSDYIWEFEPDPDMLFEPPPLLPPYVPSQETLLYLPLILRVSPQ